ncbi:MAG: adenine phosphoribosyltransferase [Candidatus Hydrogenedentota bacterium]
MDLAALVRNVPDFPVPGIQFKDITTVLEDGDALRHIIDTWKARYSGRGLTAIVGVEARGFVFGGALAYAMGLGFVPARKPGKLPYKTISESYALEYGVNELHMHVDALKPGDKVVVIDDLLATGGTVDAVCKLVERLGATIDELAFVIELPPLKGREKLARYPVNTMIEFMVE